MDEELPCKRELDILADPFAVGVMKDGTIVGHFPRKIFICSLSLQSNRSIVCVVGRRRFSADLPLITAREGVAERGLHGLVPLLTGFRYW